MRLRVAVIILTIAPALFAQNPESESWIDSPEAYFATQEERREWKDLNSNAAREAFKQRYFLRRDPTPGTARNEFRDTITARIKVADERFAIGLTRGSRTARGMVFIVLGTPAQARDVRQSFPPPPPPPGSTAPRGPVGFGEGTESEVLWTYDRQRTPKILDAVGLPSLEMRIIIEPNRKRDRLQNPGLFNDLREKLAQKSITNPNLIAPPRESAPVRGIAGLDFPDHHDFAPSVVQVLENAPATSLSSGGHTFNHAVIWRDEQPVTVVWFFLPDVEPAETEDLIFYGLVNSEAGQEAARIAKSVVPDSAFLTSTSGTVAAARIPLAPGNYTGHFAVFRQKSKTPVVSARANITVPDGSFAVPALVLSGGANVATNGTSGDFILGRAEVQPRADATFLNSESLWYFFEVVNPAQPEKVTAEVRLRSGTQWIGAPRTLSAGLQKVAERRYVGGFEMPLGNLAPGDYSLYVTLKDAAGMAVRRADFRILAR